MIAMHYFYLARCADNTLYGGYTNDIKKREAAHNEGTGAKYTSGRRPIKIIYFEEFETKSEAMSREWEVKRWKREDKEALIKNGGPKEGPQ